MALRRGDRAFLHGLRGGLARIQGNTSSALRDYRTAALLSAEAGLPWLECLARQALAQLLAAAGDRPGADAHARGAEALATRLGSPLLRLAGLFTEASTGLAFDDEAAALVPLQAGMALARELGVQHVIGLPPPLLGNLCALALRRSLAVDQARSFVNAGRLAAPPAALRLRQWPRAFQITTLGRFALQRAGETVEFSARGPGRPVELLKVLVSLGGREVRTDQLADALWPRAEADYAHKSFTATLHRLRRVFDDEEVLKLSDGRLSLNASLCWLDTWALDDLFNELDTRLRDADARAADPALRARVEEALALYTGPFLSDEAEQPAYLARREQLRARLLRALSRVARRWEDSGHGDAAIDGYLRCIEADELCEAFYRHLMQCHQRRGELAEAQATYRRLQTVLAARLAGVPSSETQALHAGMRG
jgi:DNA-binding SARP family transcriptional activator